MPAQLSSLPLIMHSALFLNLGAACLTILSLPAAAASHHAWDSHPRKLHPSRISAASNAEPGPTTSGPLMGRDTTLKVSLPDNDDKENQHPKKNVFIVELRGGPSILRGSADTLAGERSQLAASLARLGIRHRVVHANDSTLIHGVALELEDPAHVSAVALLPGVKAVHSSRWLSVSSTTTTSTPPAEYSPAIEGLEDAVHNMTGVSEVHRLLGITGKGIKVGIIGSGIDYTHPAFGACSRVGKGCRVAFGYDFVGDEYNPLSDNATLATPSPDNDPMECAKPGASLDGTHKAGIIAGRDSQFLGVAPDATLGVYKIASCSWPGSSSLVLAALEMAYKDGMDVISVDTGRIVRTSSLWPEADPVALAIDRLASKGVVVVSSSGQNGGLGPWSSLPAANAPGAISVASFGSTAALSRGLRVSPGDTNIRYTKVGSPNDYIALDNGTLAVSSNDTSAKGDFCKPYNSSAQFDGKVVLIRGAPTGSGCFHMTQALNAQNAGAVAVLIYQEMFAPQWLGPKVTIPGVVIPLVDGEYLVALSQQETVQVFFPKHPLLFPNPFPQENHMTSDSAWGPAPNFSLKPDVGAPGDQIYSAVPVTAGGYKVYNGNEFAGPHVAGVVALYLSANRKPRSKVSAAAVKQVLQNSAVPAVISRIGMGTPVALQGAGLVNALRAIRSKTTVAPSNLGLGLLRSTPRSLVRVLEVTNGGSVTMTYNLSHLPAASVDGTSDTAYPPPQAASTSVSFSPSLIVIPRGVTRKVSVAFTFNESQASSELWLHSGYIAVTPDVGVTARQGVTVTPSDDYSTVFVPFQAIVSSPEAFQILANDGWSLQSLAAVESLGYAAAYSMPDENVTFTFDSTLAGDGRTTWDVPVFNLHVLRPARVISLKLYSFTTNRFLGYIDRREYVTQDASFVQTEAGSSNVAITWAAPRHLPAVRRDPARNPSEWTIVPNGSYYVICSAVKSLGISLTTAEATETRRSPKIVIRASL